MKEYSEIIKLTSGKPIRIEVEVKPRTLLDRVFLKIGLKSKVEVLELFPVTLNTRFKFSKRVSDLKSKIGEFDLTSKDEVHEIINGKYSKELRLIIATVFHDRSFRSLGSIANILKNLESSELTMVLKIIYEQMDTGFFLSSIELILGTSFPENSIPSN